MTGRAAPLGIAMAVLVLLIALALVLIPVLDELMRRALARKAAAEATEAAEAAANDNKRAAARGTSRRVG